MAKRPLLLQFRHRCATVILLRLLLKFLDVTYAMISLLIIRLFHRDRTALCALVIVLSALWIPIQICAQEQPSSPQTIATRDAEWVMSELRSASLLLQSGKPNDAEPILRRIIAA